VLSAPVEVEPGAEVVVEVRLPNARGGATFEVGPLTTLAQVKELLHAHFRAPPPHAFELFCAARRQPLPASSAPLAATPDNPLVRPARGLHGPPFLRRAGGGQGEGGRSRGGGAEGAKGGTAAAAPLLTVLDALRLVPEQVPLPGVAAGKEAGGQLTFTGSTASTRRRQERLRLLLLPAFPARLGPTPVLLTTFSHLDEAYPVSEATTKSVDQAATTAWAAASSRSAAWPPSSSSSSSKGCDGIRPSRPAAHPAERPSKTRQSFAGSAYQQPHHSPC
jgi:hypothetical protein